MTSWAAITFQEGPNPRAGYLINPSHMHAHVHTHKMLLEPQSAASASVTPITALIRIDLFSLHLQLTQVITSEYMRVFLKK